MRGASATVLKDQAKATANREKFAKEMDIRNQK